MGDIYSQYFRYLSPLEASFISSRYMLSPGAASPLDEAEYPL